ncbi:hypothetical protein B1209_12360 [Raoultella planticola]|jgi:uridine phosphorylase|uniref:phosphorylase family protein n=1 Tax=Raoultella planticola TaxID=575 RepID=UPI000516DC63|nr:hypothetical protein [Raoultella planticola]ATM05372.1 hypothetical protein CRT62_12415 [Raoultella planticola]ATM17420.1 hypothetical protein CRN15_22435 [Raoultella planticola]AUV53481.1 hypothetical protein B1209_12360 [Raoultella planticola]ELU0691219.1 hypothetical protein [Raoultella planticola]ELU1430637.1 hypothetical protein [Raoultella planticola]
MIEALKHAEFSDKKQWWLGVRPGDLPERVILTLLIDIKPNVFARQMEDWTHLAGDTEYQAYRGSYKGMDVGVVYAGSGAYSVTTAIDELARLGIKVMVRYANSGGLSDEVNVGDYCVTTGCIRNERVLLDYIPAEYPAIADRHLVDAMLAASQEAGFPTHEGLTLTVSSFYPGSGFPTPRGVMDEEVLRKVQLFIRSGAMNIDGETSTLMVLGQLYGIRAGALLTVGNHLTKGEGDYITGQDDLVRTGLEALLKDKLRTENDAV